MRCSALAITIALQISLSAAWPWPPSIGDINAVFGRQIANPLPDEKEKSSSTEARQDANQPSSTFANDNAPTSTFPKETGTNTDSAKITNGPQSGKQTATTGAKSGSATAPMTSAASIPINAAAGGISMLTPAQTTATYAKIGYPITFVWNYTSLLAPPSYVDVVASNTDGVWTITSNMTVKETGSVVWNTSNEATPLPMESYTFVVYDAKVGPTAVPSPGHLSPYLGYPFAMYSPKAAVAANERQSLKVLLGTCMLTVLSFTYFSCGFMGVL